MGIRVVPDSNAAQLSAIQQMATLRQRLGQEFRTLKCSAVVRLRFAGKTQILWGHHKDGGQKVRYDVPVDGLWRLVKMNRGVSHATTAGHQMQDWVYVEYAGSEVQPELEGVCFQIEFNDLLAHLAVD